ncbi:MAG: hypothetical protein L3J23_03110 [Flavobacteriaceae bacterium]|nr:hypothetical protein [Flavobacteriaceae bacterium]
MGNASPQSLLLAGIALAGIAFKLKTDYLYFYYIGVTLGLTLFIIGIVKYLQQKNRYK